jgi:hypothetical protein
MSYPAGTLWLAGANGDCSQAGTCPDGGPCGDGEIGVGDCPDFWSSTAAYGVTYLNASTLNVNGRFLSVGETIRFRRGLSIPQAPGAYPAEYFRAALDAYSADKSPPPQAGITMTISNVLPDALIRITLDYSYTLNFKNKILGSASSRVFTYAGQGMSLGEMYHSWRGSGRKYVKQRVSDGRWFTLFHGTVPMAVHMGTEFTFSDGSISGTTPAGYSWGGDVSFSGWSPPSDMPSDPAQQVISWGVETALGLAIPPTNYASLPVAAAPGGFVFPSFVEGDLVDVITVVAIPSDPFFNSAAALTVRSACVEPAP